MNDFISKCSILGELWFSYRQESSFEDFIEYNDMGLPMAFLVSEGLVKCEPQGEIYINETWDLLIAALGADPEAEYQDLDHLLDSSTIEE